MPETPPTYLQQREEISVAPTRWIIPKPSSFPAIGCVKSLTHDFRRGSRRFRSNTCVWVCIGPLWPSSVCMLKPFVDTQIKNVLAIMISTGIRFKIKTVTGMKAQLSRCNRPSDLSIPQTPTPWRFCDSVGWASRMGGL